MKKRLLSAALALAMVLTLLPVSAFAATVSVSYQTAELTGTNVYYAAGTTWSEGYYSGNGSQTSPYTKVSGGAVLSAGSFNLNNGTMTRATSGQHAASDTDFGTSASFTLLAASQTITTAQTNVNIDLNGSGLTKVDMTKGGKVTIGNSAYDPADAANTTKTVGTIVFTNSGDDAAATVVIGAGVKVTTLTLLGARANTVIVVNGEVGGVTMNGVGKSSSGANVNAKQTLTVTGLNAKTGEVTMTGDGSAISVTNGTIDGNVTLTGTGTTLNLQNGTAKAVTVLGSEAEADKAKAAPKITINGYGAGVTSIGKISGKTEKVTGAVTVEVTNGGSGGNINLPNGKVTVANSSAGTIDLENGELTLGNDQNKLTATNVGDLTLGSAGYGAVKVDVKGSKVTTGTIKANTGNEKTITLNIPADPDNNFGKITKDQYMSPNTIKGGNFTDPVDKALLTGVLYERTLKAGSNYKTSYWAEAAINELVARYTTDDTVVVLGTTSKTNTLTLNQGDDVATAKEVFKVSFDGSQTFTLPSVVGGRAIKEWTIAGQASGAIQGGMPVTLSTTKEYVAGALGYQVTKVTRTDCKTAGVSAVLSGNVITLSGTVPQTGTNVIDINLITDAGDVKAQASVVGNPNGTVGTLLFVDNGIATATNGVIQLADNNTALHLVNSGVKYTLKDGGLKVKPTGLTLDGNDATNKADTVVTVTDTKLGNKEYLDNLSETLTKLGVDGTDFSKSPAVLEKFGQAIGTISSSQVDSYRRTAQDQAYRKEHNNQSPKDDADRAGTGYMNVYAVLYLDVKVSSLGKSLTADGNMTATLTPSWRVEVRAGAGKDPIVVKTGASLGVLTGEPGTSKITLPVGTGFGMTALKAHQNSTYVYDVTAGTNVATLDITHAANTGDGFGTIVLSTNTAPITITRDKDGNPVTTPAPTTDVTYGYSTLQAAVDDTINGDTIKVGADITGEQPIIVTGKARKFSVEVIGNATVKNGNGSSLVTVEANGNTWEVQLKQDVAATTTGNITINTATGGTASVSANPATVGSTVTITLSASAGYTASGVSVKTSSGTTVSVSGSGSTYTFTMPSGSVTVTPSFSATQQTVNATVSVVNPSTGGSAVTSAGSNKVAAGTTVTVTTSPSVGQRTMGVYVTGATATRTGANTFSFVVPSGYTNVTVTPRFDQNNGTLFEDVWSTDYYSNAVAWAVGKGITNGDGSVYRFGSGNSCTRQDMVTFLWRNAGSPVVTGVTNPFYDVQVGSYYYNAVMWAVKNGITKGVTSTRFGVGETVTRAQAVTFLYRASGSPSASANNNFYDVPSNEYYAKAVTWAANKGITNGDGGATRFNPNGSCLRAQIVTFMYRNATTA